MSRRTVAILISSLLFLAGFAAIYILMVSEPAGTPPKKSDYGFLQDSGKLQVGFLLGGPAGDWGYNHQHQLGRRDLQSILRDKVHTVLVEDTQEPEHAGEILEGMCAAGAQLIFSTLDRHQDAVFRVAERHPDVRFLQFFGRKRLPNLGSYGLHDWEPAYACGVVAAEVARADKRLGFIGPPALPTKWIANAFTRGARSINSDMIVEVIQTGDWYDPGGEVRATEALAARGVKVVYIMMIKPLAALEKAEDLGLLVFTHFANLSSFAPRRWLTGSLWQWNRFYVDTCREILDGSWKARHQEGGFREGYVALAPFGLEVGIPVQETARKTIEGIISEEIRIFSGPLHDQQGDLKVPAGKTLTPREIRSMNWFLQGIASSVQSPDPKSPE